MQRIATAISGLMIAATLGAPAPAESRGGAPLLIEGVPIEICLTISHEIICASFVDAEGQPWAVLDTALFPPDLDGFEEGDDIYVSGTLCQLNCPVFFCGDFVGIIVSATITSCPSAGDVQPDGAVDFQDLLAVLAQWGPCAGAPECAADLNDDGSVDFEDLLMVLTSWGQ